MRYPITLAIVLLVGAALPLAAQDEPQAPTGNMGYDAARNAADRALDVLQSGEWKEGLALMAGVAEALDRAGAPSDALRVRSDIIDTITAYQPTDWHDPAVEEAVTRLLEWAVAAEDAPLQARALIARSLLRRGAGKPREAAADLQAAVSQAARLGSGLLLATATMNLRGLAHAGAEVPNLDAYERQAVSLLAAHGAKPSDTALNLLHSLAYSRASAGDTDSAAVAATAATLGALESGERWRVLGTLDNMGGTLRQAHGDVPPEAYIEAVQSRVEALEDPALRALALGVLARIAQGGRALGAAIELALREGGDAVPPEDTARALMDAAESQDAVGDRAEASRYRGMAEAALVVIAEPERRIQVAMEACERRAGSSDRGRWGLDLILAVRASLPESAAPALIRATIYAAELRRRVAQQEYQEAVQAAQNAGQDSSTVESPLEAARLAAMEDLDSLRPLLDNPAAPIEDARLLSQLAQLERELGDHLSAESTLTRAIAEARLDPDALVLMNALWQQALTQHELGRDARAADLAAEALHVPGTDMGAWRAYEAAGLLANAGRYDEAVAEYNGIVERGGSEGIKVELLFSRGWAHLMAGHEVEARSDLGAVTADGSMPARVASAVLGREEPAPLAGAEPAYDYLLQWAFRGPMNTTGETRRLATLANAAIAGLRGLGAADSDLAGWRIRQSESLNLAGDYEGAHAAVDGVAEVLAVQGGVDLQVRALRAEATALAGLDRNDEAEALWAEADALLAIHG